MCHHLCRPQVKEMALIRNTILECQVCGESAARFWTIPGIWNPKTRPVCLQASTSPAPAAPPTPASAACPAWTACSTPATSADPARPEPPATGRTAATSTRYREHHRDRQTGPASFNAPPPPPQCELQPCFSPEACVNTMGGFSCHPCPPGLWGPPLAGTGLDYAKAHRQVRPKGATPQSPNMPPGAFLPQELKASSSSFAHLQHFLFHSFTSSTLL